MLVPYRENSLIKGNVLWSTKQREEKMKALPLYCTDTRILYTRNTSTIEGVLGCGVVVGLWLQPVRRPLEVCIEGWDYLTESVYNKTQIMMKIKLMLYAATIALQCCKHTHLKNIF